MALKRKKPEFTLLRGAVPKPSNVDAPATPPPPAIPATQNSLAPTTVIYWGYWKSVGDEIAIAGATAAPSPSTGVTASSGQPDAGATAATTDTLQRSQGSFLYKIAPIGATGATA
jgi:hypothetical protein